MTTDNEPAVESYRVVCPICHGINEYGAPYCRNCRSRLVGGTVISEAESERRLEAERKRAVRAKWLRRSRWLIPIAIIGAIVGFFLYSPVPSPLPTGTTNASSASPSGEWTMSGINLAQTRSISEPYPPKRGEQIWRVDLGETFVSAPVVAGYTVYIVTGEGRIVAVNATNGSTRWQRDIGAPSDSAPTIAGDMLYVGLRSRNLLALNRHTGETLWTFFADGPITPSPVVSKGVVYVGSSMDAKITALDAVTGEELWRTDLNERQLSSPASWAENYMVVAASDKVIYYDKRSKDRVFTSQPFAPMVGAPAILDDSVYVSTSTGGIIAFRLEARNSTLEGPIRRIWGNLWLLGMAPRPPQPSGFIWGYSVRDTLLAPPAVTNEALYFGTVHGDITALNRTTQEVIWKFKGDGAVRGAPTVVGDTLYVGSGRYLYGLNTGNGQKLWEFQTSADITSEVVVTRDAIYIADEQSNLYAIK